MNKSLIQNFRCWLIASVRRRSPPELIPMPLRLWEGLRQAMENVLRTDRVLQRTSTRTTYVQRYGGQSLDWTMKLANINRPLIMMKSAFMSINRDDVTKNSKGITKRKMQIKMNVNNKTNKHKEITDEDMRYSQCKMPTIICRQRGALNDRAAYLRRLTSNGFRNFTS